METEAIIAKLHSYWADRPEGVVCAYLFGSRARNQGRPDSDVDLGVLFERTPPPTLAGGSIALAGDIEAALGLPVDLVVLNAAPVDLVHRVLRDGILLLERDPVERIRFETKARSEYFDLKPYLDEYRRAGARHG